MHGKGACRGHAWKGGMCGWEVCVAERHTLLGAMHGGGGMCGWGHAWQGGVHGEGGHAWQRGACTAGGMHGWGVCVVRGPCMVCTPPPFYEIWPVNAWVVCILLECILVFNITDFFPRDTTYIFYVYIYILHFTFELLRGISTINENFPLQFYLEFTKHIFTVLYKGMQENNKFKSIL